MVDRSRLTIAKPDIFSVLRSAPPVMTRADLAQVLTEHRSDWRLAQRTTVEEFITFLKGKGDLHEHVLRAPEYNQVLKRYSWGTTDVRSLALSIRRNSYLTHGSAVWVHALTDLIPQKIFINAEQSPKQSQSTALIQHSIDLAFSRPARTSRLFYKYKNSEIVVLSGKNTARLGVIQVPLSENLKVDVTNLERTLIDITVRPNYAGGIYEVLEAYKRAADRISTNRLAALLKKLNYTYPYHQSIGFLMQRAGYPPNKYAFMSEIGMDVDFYLLHGMKSKQYDSKWRLFYPEGL